MDPFQKFRRRIALVCVVITAMHILACLYFTVCSKGVFGQTKIGSFYRVRVLSGPFFIADRLKSSHHFLVSYKTQQGTWSPYQDDAVDNLNTYRGKPWRYDKLSQADILPHTARKFSKHRISDSLLQSDVFATMNSYIVKTMLPTDKVDSVKLIYILNSYNIEMDVMDIDTVWTLSYKLHDKFAR